MKPVLVTGGAGFIGKHLSRGLFESGYRLTLIDKVAKPKSLPRSPRVVYKKIDAYKIDRVYSTALRNSCIVHLAADVSVEKSVRDPVSTVRENIGVTCATLEFARRLDSDKFVLASTAAVYGDRSGRCKETDPPDPLSPYAVSKLASEYYCKLYSRLYGIPTVILRFFNVYGPEQSGEYAGVITRFVQRALQNEPPIIFGDGGQTRDFVYVDDIVSATLTAISKPLPSASIINVGTGKPVSITSLANTILKLFNLQYLRPVHRAPRPGDIRHSLANISTAREMLDFAPKYDLERCLGATIDWFRGRD